MTVAARGGIANLKHDVFGGLTAAVAALPLALAFGVASGAGPIASVMARPTIATDMNIDALIVGALTLAITVLWPAALRRILPSPLAALIIGTLVAIFLLPAAPRLGDIPTGLPALVLPVLDFGEMPRFLQVGGDRVLAAGLASAALKVLHKLKALDRVPKEWRFEHRSEAVKTAVALVGMEQPAAAG